MSDPTTPTTKTHTFTIEAHDITHDTSAWTTEQINAMERESLEAWAKIDDDQKRSLVVIMRDCLMRMFEDPLEWLPISLKPEAGMRLGVFIYVGTDSVEDEILELRQIGQKNLNDQLVQLLQIADASRPPDEASNEPEAAPEG